MPIRSRTTDSQDNDRPTYLAKPLAEVAAVLDDRIAKGRQLHGQFDVMVFPQPGRADDLSAQFSAWRNFNKTYLERAFTTKELHDWYEGAVYFAVGGGRQSDLDRLRELVHDLQRDINKLVDLRERLQLYEPPETQAAPPSTSQHNTRKTPKAMTVTFQGNVGQVNLADLVERADARIAQVDQRGEVGLAKALQELTNAIKAANEAAQDKREDALDAVSVLAEVGSVASQDRGRLRGRVRGAVEVIQELAAAAPAVKNAWDAWGPTILEHLPRLNQT
jgi:hypothetical protein